MLLVWSLLGHGAALTLVLLALLHVEERLLQRWLLGRLSAAPALSQVALPNLLAMDQPPLDILDLGLEVELLHHVLVLPAPVVVDEHLLRQVQVLDNGQAAPLLFFCLTFPAEGRVPLILPQLLKLQLRVQSSEQAFDLLIQELSALEELLLRVLLGCHLVLLRDALLQAVLVFHVLDDLQARVFIIHVVVQVLHFDLVEQVELPKLLRLLAGAEKVAFRVLESVLELILHLQLARVVRVALLNMLFALLSVDHDLAVLGGAAPGV